MNKADLVKILAKKYDLSQSKINDIVSTILESITKSLSKSESVAFVGFGTFNVKKRLARIGRNPQTGETLKIPAKKIVRFTVGKGLKDAVKK